MPNFGERYSIMLIKNLLTIPLPKKVYLPKKMMILKINFIKLFIKWSGRQDLNLRPSGPKPDALPGCATPRLVVLYLFYLSFQQLKEKENDTKYEHM